MLHVPDFIGTRYGGNLVRACAVFVLFIASFTYVTAQINATGTIASRALGIPFEAGVWVGLISILICSMLGGMRAELDSGCSVHCINHCVLDTSILDQF